VLLEDDIEWVIKHNDLAPTVADLVGQFGTHEAAVRAAVHRLENGHKIVIDPHGSIIWVAVDNPKLRSLIDSSVKLK
jgi:hypothetical protein